MELEDIVSKYPPKQIMLVPIAIIILALISLGATYLATGSPVKLGIEFTGGTLVTVPSTESEEKVAAEFASYPLVDIRNIGGRYMLQFGPMSESQYADLVKLANSNFDSPEIRHIGPIYSKELQAQVIKYLPLSFLLDGHSGLPGVQGTYRFSADCDQCAGRHFDGSGFHELYGRTALTGNGGCSSHAHRLFC